MWLTCDEVCLSKINNYKRKEIVFVNQTLLTGFLDRALRSSTTCFCELFLFYFKEIFGFEKI